MKKTIWFVAAQLMLGALFFMPIKDASAQAKFGVKGGYNLSDMKYEARSSVGDLPNSKSLSGFHLGLVADLPIVDVLSIQPAVLYNSIGSKIERGSDDAGYTVKINPQYVDIPVNILFKPQIAEGTRLYVGAGPYIGFGVGGKASVKGNVGDISGYADHDLKFGNSSDDDLKSTDIGGNVLAGLEFGSGFTIGAQYGASFTNNAPKGDDSDAKILKNKVFSISVGFLF